MKRILMMKFEELLMKSNKMDPILLIRIVAGIHQ